MPNCGVDRSAIDWSEIEMRLFKEARAHHRLKMIGRLLMVGWLIWFLLVLLY